MVVFLVIFGLAAIVLMCVIAYVRGRRAGLPSAGGSSDRSGASAAGFVTDWDHRSPTVSGDADHSDWSAGGDGGLGGDGGGGSDGGGSDGGGGGGDGGGD